jgi:Xaa-Pro dipeptidase
MRQRDDLLFSMAEFERRLAEVRAELGERALDGLIVTTPENIFYLTGHQTPGYYYFQALVLPVEGEPFMVTRLLEDTNVQSRTWVEQSRPFADTEDPVTVLRYALDEFGLSDKRLGYEKHSWFFRASEQEQLLTSAPEATFVDCSGLVENARLVKSDEEITLMCRSARATEAGIQAGLAVVAAGVTENDIAAEIHQAMIRAGSEYPAISPFVASGWRSAIGHATWEGRRVEPGECVFLEVGGCVGRYHTALMRTAYVGAEPPPPIAEAERLIQEAMQVSLEQIAPGVAAGDVDIQNRYILERYSHGGTQATRSGYSIGIAFAPDWGEGHILSIQAGESRYFKENMTFHLIPWLQVAGVFGMGLSETVRVTADGCESFFSLERKLYLR